MSRTKKVKEEEVTEIEKIEAATNNPDLAPDEFKVGQRTFKVMHLKHKDYLAFLALFQPGMQNIVAVSYKADQAINHAADETAKNAALIGITQDYSMALLSGGMGENLSRLVCLMCHQTDSTMTVSEVEESLEPFDMAQIVSMQIKKNDLIRKFSSFFAQTIPNLMQV